MDCQAVITDLKQDQWSSALEKLIILEDTAQGFQVTVSKNCYHRQIISPQPDPFKIDLRPSYALQGINLIFAAHRLCDYQNISEDFTAIAIAFLQQIVNINDDENALRLLSGMFYRQLLPLLEKHFQGEDIENLIFELKDFNNLLIKPRTLKTTFNIYDNVFQPKRIKISIVDEPQTQLTSELIEEFENYQCSDWFVKLSEIEKKFVATAVEQVLYQKPTPMIPTQLRKYLPGLRNCYKETLMVDGKEAYQGYHFANPGHLTKDANKRLTLMSFNQFHEIAAAKKSLIATLISPNNILNRDDSELVRQCKFANDYKEEIDYINIPLNWGRSLPDLKPWNKSFDKDGLAYVIAKAKELLQTGHKSAPQFDLLINAYRSAKNNYKGSHFTEFFTKKNRNLDLMVAVNELCFAINRVANQHLIAEGNGCISGKDRDAILRLFTLADIISKRTQLSLEQCVLLLSQTLHLQKIASYIGGTLGALGIKEEAFCVLPYEYKTPLLPVLFLPPARNNKHLPTFKHGAIELDLDTQIDGVDSSEYTTSLIYK